MECFDKLVWVHITSLLSHSFDPLQFAYTPKWLSTGQCAEPPAHKCSLIMIDGVRSPLPSVMIFVLSQSMTWFVLLQRSVIADLRFSYSAFSLCVLVSRADVFFSHSFWCSFFLVLNVLPVSPIYVLLHEPHVISYITLQFGSCSIWSWGWTRSCCSCMCGFTAVFMLCF